MKKEKVLIRESDIAQAERSRELWVFGNNYLYELCGNNPYHQKKDVVLAKIWLIGRGYAAAIERSRGQAVEKFRPNDELYKHVVEVMTDSECELDNLLLNLIEVA